MAVYHTSSPFGSSTALACERASPKARRTSVSASADLDDLRADMLNPRESSDLPEVILLADFHAAMAQDVVGGGDVEKEIRKREVQQVGLALEVQDPAAARLDRDVAVLRAVDLGRLEFLAEGDGALDARLELGKARLLVLPARRLGAGEARGRPFRSVGGDLDLAGQRKHVGREASAEERRRIDFLRLGEARRLVEDRVEVAEGLDENGNGSLVHRECHDMSPGCEGSGDEAAIV